VESNHQIIYILNLLIGRINGETEEEIIDEEIDENN
jgi:hypothetical protein